MFLEGKRIYFAIFLMIIIPINACSHLIADDPKELEKEMRSISKLVASEKLKELKKKMTELKNRQKEFNINIEIFDKSTSRLRLGINSLKPEYHDLESLAGRPATGKKRSESVLSIEDTIEIMENDIQWLKGQNQQ